MYCIDTHMVIKNIENHFSIDKKEMVEFETVKTIPHNYASKPSVVHELKSNIKFTK